MEKWCRDTLRHDFSEAVKYVDTRKGAALPESAQRRLFGLYTRATKGVPPPQVPPGQHEEHYAAWCEAGQLSEVEAMEEYIDTVGRNDPQYLKLDDSGDDAEMPESELPAGVKEQLAAAGIRGASPTGTDGVPQDVFAAARAGTGLAPFLPSDADAVDADGLTPLIHAVDAEQTGSVSELLLCGADVNRADPQGSTALHYAALLGNAALAEQLVAAGADPRILDEDGSSPADTAGSEGHADLGRMLAEAVAKFHG